MDQTPILRPLMPHGGMLAQARLLFPHAPEPFIDLSTGINPVAYPLQPFAPEAFTRLPEAADIAALERVAAAAFGVPDSACVLAGPGTQIFISLLPRLIGKRRVSVLSPTYSEHALAWRSAGCEVLESASLDVIAEADIAVVCNPNNPDGRVIARADLAALADIMARKGGMLVVDEAFADLEPAVSIADHAGLSGLIILRSFGKWSGLAGLRLGFVLGESALMAVLRNALGPWCVSGPALAAGIQALPDRAWRAEASVRLARDAARLDTALLAHGMTLVGGTRLFRLYEGEDAQKLWQRLGGAGILTRRFDYAPKWLRLGIPAGKIAIP